MISVEENSGYGKGGKRDIPSGNQARIEMRHRGSNLNLKESDVVCPTAFASIYYRIYAYDRGAKVGRFIQCPDTYVWDPKVRNGSVLFEINAEEK